MRAPLVIAAAGFLVAWPTTGLLARVLGRRLLDIPNERSSHRVPTPRGGGLGILAGLAVGLACAAWMGAPLPPVGFLAATAAIAACGWLDDLLGLRVAFRLLVQFSAAALVVAGAGPLARAPLPPPLDFPLGPAAVPISLVWILGVVNIYNFLDGIDGFAGLQALIAGGALAAMAFNQESQALGLALAGASLGFLLHNWHPARIFMGDVGSTAIGFLLAAAPFSVEPGRRSLALFSVALSLWFFLADGSFTLLGRFLRGERIWQAHREHVYQRLVRAGHSHDAVAIRVGAMALAVSVAAVLGVRLGQPLVSWSALALAGASFAFYIRWALHKQPSGTVVVA